MKRYAKIFIVSTAIIIINIKPLISQIKFHNPLPAPYILYGIFFVDSLYGWAGGEFSTIIQTTDGGNTWQLQQAPLRTTVRKIYFADRDRGVIVGGDVSVPSSGSVLYTTNGGETWIDSNPVSNPNTGGFNDLHFVSENLGFIAGFTGVYKTTDMGQTWEQKGGTGWATTIFFIDSLNGWLGNTVGFMNRTTNGGDTWEQTADIHWTWNKDIKFINSQIGWVVGHGLYSEYASIHKTTDGGFTWVTQDSVLNRSYNAIDIIDSLNAMVVGNPGIVLYTTDGGDNWYFEGINNVGEYQDITLQGSRKWIVGGSNNYYPKMFASRDAGFPWEEKSSTIVEGPINQIDFSDSLYGWCAGANGILLKTADGGNSWLKEDLFSINFTSISVPSMNDIFIAGDEGELVKSTNGGQSWQLFQISSGSYKHKIKFFSKYYGYSIEPYELRFQKTTDGGNNWIDLTTNGNFIDFCFLDSLNGWALTPNLMNWYGTLMRTTDGGESWIDTVDFESITAFNFINPKTGWIVTEDMMYKTTDGSNSWNQLGNFYDLNIEQLFFKNEFTGYMLAEKTNSLDLRTIYQTNDGGLNWVPLRKYTFIKNIFVSQTGKIWGVGDHGQILSSNEIVTSVSEIKNQTLNESFILYYNYPNPFNPNTIIRYDLPEKKIVIIKIYDVLGNEITTLVNEKKPAGTYEVEFDATGLPSGIYFYRLQAGNFIETKKMVLLR